jgi:hypothetical protein
MLRWLRRERDGRHSSRKPSHSQTSTRSKSSPASSAKLKSVMPMASGGSIIRCRAIEPRLINDSGPIAGSVRDAARSSRHGHLPL